MEILSAVAAVITILTAPVIAVTAVYWVVRGRRQDTPQLPLKDEEDGG